MANTCDNNESSQPCSWALGELSFLHLNKQCSEQDQRHCLFLWLSLDKEKPEVPPPETFIHFSLVGNGCRLSSQYIISQEIGKVLDQTFLELAIKAWAKPEFFLSFFKINLFFILLSQLHFNSSSLSFPLHVVFLPLSSTVDPLPCLPSEKAGTSTKQVITSYSKTRHILSYQSWTRQPSRRKRVP